MLRQLGSANGSTGFDGGVLGPGDGPGAGAPALGAEMPLDAAGGRAALVTAAALAATADAGGAKGALALGDDASGGGAAALALTTMLGEGLSSTALAAVRALERG